ncbi:ABC transporter substrate-binding protein [Streptomyces sp. 3MP-14]|uniref:ABC transporter substrate-binding protein n=1 Tax=Streptomyces mimosae TaxID=2586635 RepID=A0A5N5ZX22_9ACTN|nr:MULTISPECIES: ABC transporter substrate-binding protein [Streptomyces]KAB8160276.1 ABC transporter substrate-binding protein [Streptomyces mimosae]KAB8172962.1 ABC transporter substrate-binding protein [Streptomyces sp. 3MP-14]
MNARRCRTALAPTVAATLLLAGCGAEVADDSGGDAETTTVARCGEEVEYRRPERAVVYEAGSADKLFVLGLTDAVHGYVMPPANPPVEESPWAEEYARVEMLSDDLLNRELVVDERADLVVAGWQSGFSDERGITPEILDDLGIQSFLHSETCYNYPEHPFHVTPFEGLYTDLERLGEIFGVQDRAAEVVAGLRERVEAVRESAPEGRPPRVFLYDSGTEQPFTSGNQAPPNEIIEIAGGRNIFADLTERWTSVGWEPVIEADPEVIVILDYGDQPAEEKIDFLTSSPALAEVTAVRERNFHLLDYNEAISGPRIVDGAEHFGAYLRELSD